MTTLAIGRSLALFVLAGLMEIGGGYLIWRHVREGAGVAWALAGALLLVLYGFVPTHQATGFGRTYAAYGGVFIILSLLWGWRVGHVTPDRPDLVGAAVCLVGVAIMMYWPRS